MIISASYKTDIPAFYGEWFFNRLQAGYCKMVNPYSRKAIRVSLRREDVYGFVFWTKNVSPFLRYLPEVNDRGYPWLLQFSINGYPRALEFSVLQVMKSVEHFWRLVDTYGPLSCVWRYDPIVFSSITTLDFHRKNFGQLAKALAGATDEVVVSFAQVYQKTLRNMDWAAREFGFTWHDPGTEEKVSLLVDLRDIAESYGIKLAMCSQPEFLIPRVSEAHCVDAHRLGLIAGRPLPSDLRGNRPGCGCFASRDIGEYDTCPHGCVYCYAVRNRKLAQERYRKHDARGEFLFQPSPDIQEDEHPGVEDRQLRFDL